MYIKLYLIAHGAFPPPCLGLLDCRVSAPTNQQARNQEANKPTEQQTNKQANEQTPTLGPLGPTYPNLAPNEPQFGKLGHNMVPTRPPDSGLHIHVHIQYISIYPVPRLQRPPAPWCDWVIDSGPMIQWFRFNFPAAP